jgi:hypothetical protein
MKNGKFFERDRPLGFHWHTTDFARHLGVSHGNNALQRTIDAILAEAILGAEAGQRVSYSRNKSYYIARRYLGTSYTYTTVTDGVELLKQAGLITDHRVRPGSNRARQSTFEATERLLDAWHAFREPLTFEHGETIYLKDAAGNLIDYPETRLTAHLRGQLAERNEAMAAVKLEVPDAEWRGHYMVIDGSYILPVPANPLRRIFGRRSFRMHGRAYGWFQSIPRSARATATINGEPMAECDYGCLHASILYAQAGIPFTGDAYAIDGFDRRDVKRAFNIALNAPNEHATVSATIKHLECGRKHAAGVLDAIKRRHKPIEHHFCADTGMRLMRIDSELILTALKIVNDAGEPALPIHDALMVPSRCADKAEAAMREAFERTFGKAATCDVKIKRGAS